jgi:uncharacterized protein YjbI with pentapeptide repeats
MIKKICFYILLIILIIYLFNNSYINKEYFTVINPFENITIPNVPITILKKLKKGERYEILDLPYCSQLFKTSYSSNTNHIINDGTKIYQDINKPYEQKAQIENKSHGLSQILWKKSYFTWDSKPISLELHFVHINTDTGQKTSVIFPLAFTPIKNSSGTNSGGTNSGGTNSSGTNSGGTSSGTNSGGTSNGTNSNGTNSNGTNSNGTNFNGTNFNGTNSGGTNFNGTNSNGTNSNGTNSGGTNSGGTNSNGTNSNGTNFNRTNSGGTNSNGTNSNGTNFNGTNSNGTNSNGTNSGGTNSNGTSGGKSGKFDKTEAITKLFDPTLSAFDRIGELDSLIPKISDIPEKIPNKVNIGNLLSINLCEPANLILEQRYFFFAKTINNELLLIAKPQSFSRNAGLKILNNLDDPEEDIALPT